MNEWLDKNYIDLVNTFERDYEVGVELCKKNNVSALDYFRKLDGNEFFSEDVYYFLTLDRDIRGE